MIEEKERRFELRYLPLSWEERTLKQKILFWKPYSTYKLVEVFLNPEYENASYREVILTGKRYNLLEELKND